MQIKKRLIIAAPAEEVWQVFARDFNNASEWMSSVPKSFGKDLGKKFEGATSAGRVCELDGNPKGIKATESFLAYDENEKSCTVNIALTNAPAIVPIHGNVLDFSVIQSGANQSEVSWIITPNLKPFAYLLYPLVKFGLGVFMGQITEELKHFVETGKPHPRKIKATHKAQLATNG